MAAVGFVSFQPAINYPDYPFKFHFAECNLLQNTLRRLMASRRGPGKYYRNALIVWNTLLDNRARIN